MHGICTLVEFCDLFVYNVDCCQLRIYLISFSSCASFDWMASWEDMSFMRMSRLFLLKIVDI